MKKPILRILEILFYLFAVKNVMDAGVAEYQGDVFLIAAEFFAAILMLMIARWFKSRADTSSGNL